MKRMMAVLIGLSAFTAAMPSDAERWGGTGAVGGARGGAGIAARGAPAQQHMDFARNEGFSRGIAAERGREIVPGHYYYHNFGGRPYWHFYDARFHWYGFYLGPRFYWFPFYSGYWWWQDAALTRWLFWYGGYWWWYPAGGEPYIYVNDQYVPYSQYQQQAEAPAQPAPADAGAAEAAAPKPPTAPPSAPSSAAADQTPAKQGSTWLSPDKSRMVQIVGPQAQAYLYDESGPSPKLTKPLSAGVESVRYSGGAAGRPLQILLELKDGGFSLYDADGSPLQSKP